MNKVGGEKEKETTFCSDHGQSGDLDPGRRHSSTQAAWRGCNSPAPLLSPSNRRSLLCPCLLP